MAKQIDYPRATLKNSLQLAQAVDDLGGQCTTELAADKLNKKVSGAFNALIGSAVKYGLLTSKSGQLAVTQLFRDHKLAYSSDEAKKVLIKSFLSPPLFSRVTVRFNGIELPVSHFEKLLIREFDVPEQMGSRVAKYYLEGAKQCGILNSKNILKSGNHEEDEQDPTANESEALEEVSDTTVTHAVSTSSKSYTVRITGPGMDTAMAIEEPADLLIVRAMLEKIENKLGGKSSSASSEK